MSPESRISTSPANVSVPHTLSPTSPAPTPDIFRPHSSRSNYDRRSTPAGSSVPPSPPSATIPSPSPAPLAGMERRVGAHRLARMHWYGDEKETGSSVFELRERRLAIVAGLPAPRCGVGDGAAVPATAAVALADGAERKKGGSSFGWDGDGEDRGRGSELLEGAGLSGSMDEDGVGVRMAFVGSRGQEALHRTMRDSFREFLRRTSALCHSGSEWDE